MKYLEFSFRLTPASSDVEDVLESVLADAGFDSFVKSDDGEPLLAYIRQDLFDQAALDAAIADFPLPDYRIAYDFRETEDKDWNAEWEKNYFQPLVVDDECVVAATFHENPPQARYNIRINPRMSFGTGHHATTRSMMRFLLHTDIGGRVLDMGCGTSILAILASLRGATECLGVDVDEWCIGNSKENLELNGIENVRLKLGDASALENEGEFDIILANIQRNIILQDIGVYARHLAKGGHIFVSGFYVRDLPAIREAAEAQGLEFERTNEEADWCAAAFRKP